MGLPNDLQRFMFVPEHCLLNVWNVWNVRFLLVLPVLPVLLIILRVVLHVSAVLGQCTQRCRHMNQSEVRERTRIKHGAGSLVSQQIQHHMVGGKGTDGGLLWAARVALLALVVQRFCFGQFAHGPVVNGTKTFKGKLQDVGDACVHFQISHCALVAFAL